MLNVVHETISRLLYEYGSIPAEVDIRFDAPTKEWVESLTLPTISLFLFDIQENTEKRETSLQTFRSGGRAERRMPPRRIDLFYCVTALATAVADEHELLWRVLATILKHHQFPEDILHESMRRLEPIPVTRLGEKEQSDRLTDLWASLGTSPHPALCYVVTMPLDLDVSIQSPLVLTRIAKYRTPSDEFETAIHIGGVVRAKGGSPLEGVTVRTTGTSSEAAITDARGEFRLQRVPQGRVSLDVVSEGKVRKQVDVRVPAERYEIVLDE